MDLKHFQFKHPFTCLVSGPTGSGKTILVRRILKNFKTLIHNLNEPIIKVIWSYGQWQPLINIPISDNVIIKYVNAIPSDNLINEFKPNIIVFDDMMNEIDKKMENYFIKKGHHLNISVLFLVQNLFFKSLRTISLNSHYIIIMKNPRDGAQIMSLSKQIFPNSPKLLTEAYYDSTRHPYGYVLIDLTPDTPEAIRLRTRITPEEVDHLNKTFSPIIYQPKFI
jgi:GTPase SAR1 family protein